MAQNNFPILQNNGFPAANGFVSAPVTMTTGFPAFTAFQLPDDGIIRNPNPNNSFGNTQPDLASPYVQSWNFAIQRSLPADFTLDLAYVGNRGVNNQTGYNINASMIPGSGNNGRPLFQAFRRVADTGTNLGTNTSYHSLQTKFDRRFTRGLMVTTAYTWSKGLNLAEDNGGLAINLNVPLNKGRMQDNRTHVFVQSYIYELPFGKNKRWAQSGAAAWLAGGWQFQGVVNLMTGEWLTPSTSTALINAPGNASRPHLIGVVQYPREYGPGRKFFSPSAFVNPAQNTVGNSGRGIIRGPGVRELSASLFRDITLREGTVLTLRFESFNTTNTPYYNNPNTLFTSPQFGEINTAQATQRQIQLGVTLRF